MHRILIVGMLAVLLLGCRNAGMGQSSANEFAVSDGQVVLVKNGNEVGAFIMTNQRGSPEVVDYTWFLRTDGKGQFKAGDPAVQTGTVTNAQQIAFGTFKIPWSINTDGKGWVYFSKTPTQILKKGAFAMCVTTETNILAVDANDRGWRYRERPSINIKEMYKKQVNKAP